MTILNIISLQGKLRKGNANFWSWIQRRAENSLKLKRLFHLTVLMSKVKCRNEKNVLRNLVLELKQSRYIHKYISRIFIAAIFTIIKKRKKKKPDQLMLIFSQGYSNHGNLSLRKIAKFLTFSPYILYEKRVFYQRVYTFTNFL